MRRSCFAGLLVVSLLVLGAGRARAAPPPPFEPPGYTMREFFPMGPAGTTWRYEDGEHWVELTALGPGELEGEPTLRISAVSDGVPVGVRHFSSEGPLAALYVGMPEGPGMDFREEPLLFASGVRAYTGDRLSAAPRSFMGGQVMITSEVLGPTEVTVPAGSFPEALRIHTAMTHLPSGSVVSAYDSYYAEGVGMVWTRGTQSGPGGVESFDQKLVEVRGAAKAAPAPSASAAGPPAWSASGRGAR